MKNKMIVTALVSLAAATTVAGGKEVQTGASDQRSVAITVYGADVALVKDTRGIGFEPGGETRVIFQDVAARMRPETALFRPVRSGGEGDFRVVEQSFLYDLLTPAKLIEKFVGKTISAVRVHPQTGEDTVTDALLLSANNGVTLAIGGKVETNFPGRLVFPEIPPTLVDRPTLAMLCATGKGGEQLMELSYLTGGLSWQTDYVAELTDDDKKLDLGGWATITNACGTSFAAAKVQLVAGETHVLSQPSRTKMFRAQDAMAAMDAAPSVPVAREDVFEYHVYNIARPTELRDNETKQVALMEAKTIPCTREYVLEGRDVYFSGGFGEAERKEKAVVFVEFQNSKKSGLGEPLPRGIVRVYKKDATGNALFVGEDRIDHTPEEEKVRLRLGNAFDVTAARKQTDFQRLPPVGKSTNIFESAFQIVMKNAKPEAVTVTALETIPGDWEIVKESASHEKDSANKVRWKIPVPAKGQAELTYRVRVKY